MRMLTAESRSFRCPMQRYVRESVLVVARGSAATVSRCLRVRGACRTRADGGRGWRQVQLRAGAMEFVAAGGGDCAQVADRVARAIADGDGRAANVRVRVAAVPESGVVVGQVNLSGAGRQLRIQCTGARPRHVGVLLIERMARQLHQCGRTFRPRPWPDPMAGPAPGHRAGPAEIIRRKPARLRALTVDAAMAELDALDHWAHLFTDAETGTDAVIYRGGPYGYRLARLKAGAHAVYRSAQLVTSPRPIPRLTEDQAIARITASADPFLFYAAQRGRAALLYARYAGGYGLVASR